MSVSSLSCKELHGGIGGYFPDSSENEGDERLDPGCAFDLEEGAAKYHNPDCPPSPNARHGSSSPMLSYPI